MPNTHFEDRLSALLCRAFADWPNGEIYWVPVRRSSDKMCFGDADLMTTCDVAIVLRRKSFLYATCISVNPTLVLCRLDLPLVHNGSHLVHEVAHEDRLMVSGCRDIPISQGCPQALTPQIPWSTSMYDVSSAMRLRKQLASLPDSASGRGSAPISGYELDHFKNLTNLSGRAHYRVPTIRVRPSKLYVMVTFSCKLEIQAVP